LLWRKLGWSYWVIDYLCGFPLLFPFAIILLGILYLISVRTLDGQHKGLQHQCWEQCREQQHRQPTASWVNEGNERYKSLITLKHVSHVDLTLITFAYFINTLES
jgi:hypothetical protein